jgi:hypothetical protein
MISKEKSQVKADKAQEESKVVSPLTEGLLQWILKSSTGFQAKAEKLPMKKEPGMSSLQRKPEKQEEKAEKIHTVADDNCFLPNCRSVPYTGTFSYTGKVVEAMLRN